MKKDLVAQGPGTLPATSHWSAALAEEISLAMQYGALCFRSGITPKGMSEAQVQYLCSYALAIGIHPSRATSALWIPNGGRPALYTRTCLEMILARGGNVEVLELTDDLCTLKGTRHDGKSLTETVAKKACAHLLHKETWKLYPRRMLKAMATRNLAVDLFADYLSGADVSDPGDAQDEASSASADPVAAPAAKPSPVTLLTSRLTPAAAVQGVLNDPSPEGRAALVETYVTDASFDDTPLCKAVVNAAEPFDIKERAHRDLVTQVFNDKGIPGRWRTLHREKLSAYLGQTPDLEATCEAIEAAIEQYVIANPPEPKGEQ